jgi:energy-coupling factor transporter transmembrane protein EcfT
MKVLKSIWSGLRFAGLAIAVLCFVFWLFLKALFTGQLAEFCNGIDPYDEDDENY